MVDRLAAPAPDVRDEPIAGLGDALRPREVGGDREQPAEQRPVGLGQLGARTRCGGAGMSRMWVGARGAMSRIATTRSSSWTPVGGISPATIRQNRQSVGDRCPPSAPPLTTDGFVLIRNPMVPTSAGHQVRHVALALGALQPGRSSAAARTPDQPAQVRALDEERDAEVDEVDRRAPARSHGCASIDEPERRDRGRARSAPARARSTTVPWRLRPEQARGRPGCSDSTVARRVRSANGSRIDGQEQADRQDDVRDEQDREVATGIARDCRAASRIPRQAAAGRPRARPSRPRADRPTTRSPAASNAAAHLRLAVDEDARGEQRAARPRARPRSAGASGTSTPR